MIDIDWSVDCVVDLDTKYLFLRKRLSGVTLTARGAPTTGNEKPVSVGAAQERREAEISASSQRKYFKHSRLHYRHYRQYRQ